MDEKEKTNIHFTEQWGNKFRFLDHFASQDFSKHLLMCTNSTKEDWQEKTVFEGGCGSGRNTVGALKLNVKKIVATDISKGGVDATIENTQIYKPLVSAYQTSLTKLDKEVDNSYDVVFSVNCIPHISDYKNALKEMVRICKKGGLVLFNVPPTRPKLIAEVDNEIRKYTTKMCPKCLMLFSKVMVYWSKKSEVAKALCGKMEISGDLLSSYDHFGLPFTQEFTVEQISKDLKNLGCEILKIDNKISIKARKI